MVAVNIASIALALVVASFCAIVSSLVLSAAVSQHLLDLVELGVLAVDGGLERVAAQLELGDCLAETSNRAGTRFVLFDHRC